MDLKQFVEKTMRMSGPYQPVIIKLLLENDGKVSLDDLAAYLAGKDADNRKYYVSKLKKYPKTVLKKHEIAKLASGYYEFLEDISKSIDDRTELINLCEEKINEYYSRIDEKVDDGHPTGWGKKRVILISEHPYCRLCGNKPNPEKGIVLDIDHILPSSKGGSDDMENLQVLCSRCNRGKNNHLLKSAAQAHHDHLNAQEECIFCNLEGRDLIYMDNYIIAFRDAFPVTTGHTLIIPKRHVETAEELTDMESLLIFKKFQEFSKTMKEEDKTIDGFTVGFNVGKAAGQTVFHAHFHIIPRRLGDVATPTGGIRNVIPGKGKY